MIYFCETLYIWFMQALCQWRNYKNVHLVMHWFIYYVICLVLLLRVSHYYVEDRFCYHNKYYLAMKFFEWTPINTLWSQSISTLTSVNPVCRYLILISWKIVISSPKYLKGICFISSWIYKTYYLIPICLLLN